MPQQKLSTREAAAFLSLSPGTLAVWRCQRRGPRYLKIGRRVVYELADIDAYAKAHAVETSESAEMRGRHV